MKYNKNSTNRRLKNANSKKSKIKNKIGLSGLKVAMIAFIAIFVILCAAALGVAKGIIDSAPDISCIPPLPAPSPACGLRFPRR